MRKRTATGASVKNHSLTWFNSSPPPLNLAGSFILGKFQKLSTGRNHCCHSRREYFQAQHQNDRWSDSPRSTTRHLEDVAEIRLQEVEAQVNTLAAKGSLVRFSYRKILLVTAKFDKQSNTKGRASACWFRIHTRSMPRD